MPTVNILIVKYTATAQFVLITFLVSRHTKGSLQIDRGSQTPRFLDGLDPRSLDRLDKKNRFRKIRQLRQLPGNFSLCYYSLQASFSHNTALSFLFKFIICIEMSTFKAHFDLQTFP